MADSIGISEAQLLSFFLSSVFWGMYLITSAYCLRCLLWESDDKGGKLKPASTISWLMLTMALVLLVLCTTNIVLIVVHSIQAFIFSTSPEDSAAEFIGLSNWSNILGTCNIAFGKLISDGILIYRCWIVLNRSNIMIAFPALLWLAEFAVVIFIIFVEASAKGKQKVLLTVAADTQAAITAAWSMSLATNIITTGFIVYRIWRVDRESSLYGLQTQMPASVQESPGLFRRRKTALQRVIRIIIESGLMYTIVAFITFITFILGSTAFYFLSNAELQILSIAFNLIIIRVNTQPSGSESYAVQSSGLVFPLQTFSTAARTPDTGPAQIKPASPYPV
ncbi:hypothetical protein BDP27DRAFT_1317860 [Rhodocollybia butyracea]|uniref:Uncharacterized protein n=1 Tax=Rhodocollybia butyracea TaxID=206335 RepID=A0A9P5PWY0_9AGAR|nr:hypothetical protein BDP27DRAFT_1317860 [Rhodocollybia butyracea]